MYDICLCMCVCVCVHTGEGLTKLGKLSTLGNPLYSSIERSGCISWKPQMPNVFHPFFIPVFRASDIHDKMGDDAKWAHSFVMVSHNYPSMQQSSIVRTNYHCHASWGLKNLSPGTHTSTPSLPFLMEGRRISLLQCVMPASIDHAEIR